MWLTPCGLTASRSWPLENHIVIYVLPDDLGPGRFSTLYMAKDVSLYGKLAQSQGVPSFFAATINAYYRGTVAHGHGNDYHMIVLRWLEQGANSADYKVEGGEPDAETVRTIARGVEAVQTLIALETLGVLVNAGIPSTTPLVISKPAPAAPTPSSASSTAVARPRSASPGAASSRTSKRSVRWPPKPVHQP